ncbi:unnamed protein product, partial [Rotaria sp. Silwood1]
MPSPAFLRYTGIKESMIAAATTNRSRQKIKPAIKDWLKYADLGFIQKPKIRINSYMEIK